MSRHVDPRALRTGDVVSPLFNPDARLAVDHVALSTLAAAKPGWDNPGVPGDTKVRLIYGTWYETGEPARLMLATESGVRLHLRDGKPVRALGAHRPVTR